MKFAVGSTNRSKIEAAKLAIKEFFDDASVVFVSVDSGVSPQPYDSEMKRGAENRARHALEQSGSDFGIGIEGGLITASGRKYCTACCAVASKEGEIHFAYSPLFELPPKYLCEIKKGTELGEIIDKEFKKKNSKENEGAIGVLSGGRITRTDALKQSVLLALMPFIHEAYRQKSEDESEETDEITSLKRELSEKTEQLLRLQADFDNYRKFMEKEKTELIKAANEKLIVRLLGVLDDFERAIGLIKEEAHKKAVEMMLQNFLKILTDFGVKEIQTQGAKFDPMYHEAVAEEVSDKPGIVLEVLQKGYLLNGRVIRHAKVKVSKKDKEGDVYAEGKNNRN